MAGTPKRKVRRQTIWLGPLCANNKKDGVILVDATQRKRIRRIKKSQTTILLDLLCAKKKIARIW